MPLHGDKNLSKSERVRWEAISELVELTWNDPIAWYRQYFLPKYCYWYWQ